MHPTIAAIQKGNLQKVPEIKTGYTIEVSQKVTEGSKERIQKFKGLVIKVSHGTATEKTFTVRKIVQGVGVEKIFPLHSPNITKIHVAKKAKVRRQKLYYMRERFGKSARLSEKHVTDEERAAEEAKMDALYAEAVKAEEKRQAEEVKAEGEEVTQDDSTKVSETGKDESAETSPAEAAPIEEKAEEVKEEVKEEVEDKKEEEKTEEEVPADETPSEEVPAEEEKKGD